MKLARCRHAKAVAKVSVAVVIEANVAADANDGRLHRQSDGAYLFGIRQTNTKLKQRN
jgi:hypothetical protein